MNRKSLILVGFFISCVLFGQAGCQEQAKVTGGLKEVPAGPKRPIITKKDRMAAPLAKVPASKIKFEQVTRDMNEIGTGTENLCEFKFKNVGDDVLKITKVSKTCNCTPYTLEKTEYLPGENGVLKVSYQASSRPGSVARRLYVYSNDPNTPQITLTIKAKVVVKVDYEPKVLNLYLKKEDTRCPEITIKSLDGQPFGIKGFKSTLDCMTADIDYTATATEFVIKPKIEVEKLQRGVDGRIDVNLTHPMCNLVTIPFDVPADFKVSPPAIVLFNSEPQKSLIREVSIQSNYDDSFEIESVSSRNGIIKVTNQEKIGDVYKLKLEITPPAVEGNQKSYTDVFSVTMKDGKKVEITCRGFYSVKK